jgi:hypothetical protein
MEVRRLFLALVVVGCVILGVASSALADPGASTQYDQEFNAIGSTAVEEGTNANYAWFAEAFGGESVIRAYNQNGSTPPITQQLVIDGTNGQPVADPAGVLNTTISGMAYDGTNGWLYLVDHFYNRVLGYKRDTPTTVDKSATVQIPGPVANGAAAIGSGNGQFNEPYGLALSEPTSQLFVGDFQNARIQSFTTGSGVPTYQNQFSAPDWATGPSGIRPLKMAAYPGAWVFVAVMGANRIDKFGVGGDFQGSINTGIDGSAVRSLAVDVNGASLLVATQYEIRVYSINGLRFMGTLPTTTLSGSETWQALAMDSSRTLYTANSTDTFSEGRFRDLGSRPNCPSTGPLSVNAGESISFAPTCTNDVNTPRRYEVYNSPALGSASVQTGPDQINFTANPGVNGQASITYSVGTVNGQSVNHTQLINVNGPSTPVTPPSDPANPPTYKDDANLSRSTGVILVKLPGSNVFVPLEKDAAVPLGTVVDARNGVAVITWARPDGTTYSGQFWAGVFQIQQTTGADPLGVVKLRDDLVTAAARSSVSTAAGIASVGTQFKAYTARKKGKRKNRVWGDAKGRFRTDGSNSSASVRGTKWLVENYANATRTFVERGIVDVQVYKNKKKKIRLKKGQSYYAWR